MSSFRQRLRLGLCHDRFMQLAERREQFRLLHEQGTFLMPNPHDVGTCRLLSTLGFSALATTSGGHSASLGRMDMTERRAGLVEHVYALAGATDLPLSVDAERCYPEEVGGVQETVRLLAEAGASGCSIEDWNPRTGRIEDLGLAVERVGVAAAEAGRHGMVLTARAENHLRGTNNLDDTVLRLTSYREAGAHVVYAPAVPDLDAIERIVKDTGAPVNVLLQPGGPSADELRRIGVRRLSVGSALARIAYGAFVGAAVDLLASGRLEQSWPYLDPELSSRAFATE
jgi:2-methylisocitrate lyase-like PEP mutase family enzyme